MKTYQIKAFGCKVNQYEVQQISEFLQKLGLRAVEPSEPADLAVVHSCAVTSRAVGKSLQAVRGFLRHKIPTVLVSGCGVHWAKAQLNKLGASVKLMPEAQDIANVLYKISTRQVAPNNLSATVNQGSKAPGRNKQCIIPVTALANAAASKPNKTLSNHIQTTWIGQVKGEFNCDRLVNYGRLTQKAVLGPIMSFSGHQRAFVKVQDGCDAFCNYCLVPYLQPKLSWRTGWSV